MTADQRLLVIGIYIYSSLYLAGCFVAGLFFSGWAWKCALASFGASYITYYLQIMWATAPVTWQRLVVLFAFWLSFSFGVASGILLLIRW